MKISPFLNRYTSLPILLDILKRKKITLLNPKLWEDRNDLYCIEQYKELGKHKTVLGLCFSTVRETFHHWKIFSNGASGVCIEFHKIKLLQNLPAQQGFRHGPVEYRRLEEIEVESIEQNKIPFLKRWAYRDEKEYRIIYEHSQEDVQTKDIPIKLGYIKKITLSPWLPRSVSETVIDVIKSLPDCDQLLVNRSTLVENDRWKKAIFNGCRTPVTKPVISKSNPLSANINAQRLQSR